MPRMIADHCDCLPQRRARSCAGRRCRLLQATTQRIGQQPLGEVFNEHVLSSQQDFAQARRPLNLVPSGKAPEASIGPAPRQTELRQPPRPSKFSSAKPSGSIAVAHGAGWIGPVLFHALAHGQLLCGRVIFQRGNIRRRRWRRRTQAAPAPTFRGWSALSGLDRRSPPGCWPVRAVRIGSDLRA